MVVTQLLLKKWVLNMIMHECSHVGCTALIPYNVRYCDKHKKQKSHETIKAHKRNDKFWGFYQSTQWRKTRNAYMDGHPWCEECLRNGHHKLATSIDHVKPLKLCDKNEQLNFDNLQSLCAKCHNYKTRQEQKSYINK